MQKKLPKRKCKQCKEVFQKLRPLQYCCSYRCSLLYAKEAREKKEAKQWRVEKRELKEKLKTKSDYEADLQRPINKIARLIDKGSNCMMCNNVMNRTNGCHYHSRGANTTIKFHLHNIWIGCHSCNSERGGNIIGYDNRLIEVYGRDKWEYIKFELCQIEPLHLTIDELKPIIKEANKIVRELEKIDFIYSPEIRWELRNKMNKRLGIYE